jgi:uncharacterized protein (DUF1015 family)
MSIVKPFKALRPEPSLAPRVASRPYDVLNSAEARQEAEGNPYSFYHISKSEIDLPADQDIHAPAVYQKAKENLERFSNEGTLIREEKPCYYIYQLQMHGGKQTGITGVSAVSDYERGVIKKHELTRPEKEQDRINHITVTGAQTGNVFLTYHAREALDELVSGWQKAHRPVYDFTTPDGVSHTVWVVDDPETISRITNEFSETPCTYIADGHHRAASAAKVAGRLEQAGTTLAPGAAARFFLTTLFPDNQLSILDYNRVVTDLNGLSAEEFLSRLDYDFTVEDTDKNAVKPSSAHEFGMYLGGKWYRLLSRDGTYTTDPIGVLDVTILQQQVLGKLLGIGDPRTDKRIDFVGGIRGTGELVRRVDSGEMAVAFTVYPVSMEQLFDIADSGEIMPPKSTWFEPKLRDGLLTHLIAD